MYVKGLTCRRRSNCFDDAAVFNSPAGRSVEAAVDAAVDASEMDPVSGRQSQRWCRSGPAPGFLAPETVNNY